MEYINRVTKGYLSEYRQILDRMICQMTSAEMTCNISNDFISQMIPHHFAAIEMSKNILKYTRNIPLQNIARGIIEEQTKSISDMRQILRKCDKIENTRKEVCSYRHRTEEILRRMFSCMKTAYVDDRLNCNFMREMIPHHMGAVEMSENALNYAVCPDLVPVLEAIITSQKRGIKEMKRLLQALNCKQNY